MGSHQLTITRNEGPHRLTFTGALPRASLTPIAAPGSERYFATYVQGGGADVRLPLAITTTDVSTPALTLNYTLGGTATEGTHYEMLSPNPLTMSAGQPTAEILVRPLDTGKWHGEKRLEVTVSASSDTRVEGYPLTFYVFIRSPQAAPRVSWSTGAQSGSAGGNMTLTASLNGLADDDVKLAFRVNSGATTIDAADYTLPSSPITVSAGSLTQTATLSIGAGASSGETIRLDVRNDERTSQANLWTFSETWAEETKDTSRGSTLVLYPAHAADGLWSGGLSELSDGTNPDGSGAGALLVVADGSSSTPYYTKSVRAATTDASGDSCGGLSQRLEVASTNLLSVYVKQPTAVSRRSEYFALAFQDRDNGVSHRAVFQWVAGVPTVYETTNLDTSRGDQAAWITSQEWDHSQESNGWYRVALSYAGASAPSTAKGVTSLTGDLGNFIERRFFPFWPVGTATVATSAGKGTVVAWPQFERAVNLTAYQAQNNQWGESPWGAIGDSSGSLSHTVTVS